MSKYTPGPWEVHKTKRGLAILHPLINEEGEYNGKLGGYHVVVQERQLSPEGIETKLEEANAHLIAAAPELLEALKLFIQFFDEMPKGQLGSISCDIGILNDAFLKSKKAIAHAKGEK